MSPPFDLYQQQPCRIHGFLYPRRHRCHPLNCTFVLMSAQEDPSHSPVISPEIATQDIYRPTAPAHPDDHASTTYAAHTAVSDSSKTIYVSELDQLVTDADLLQAFDQYGPIAFIRVAKNPLLMRPLGYAYVNYEEKESADAALAHDFRYIKGKPCRVTAYQKDPSLRIAPRTIVYIKNLAPETSEDSLRELFAQFGPIVATKLARDDDNANPSGYAYVNFETLDAANEAIAKLNATKINDRLVFIGHHISQVERLSRIEKRKATFSNLYIKNLDASTTEQQFQDLFSPYGNLASYTLPLNEDGTSRGFGFVNFETHDEAVKAIEALNDKEINGKALYVGRAQKKFERDEEIRQQFDMLKIRNPPLRHAPSNNLYIKELDPSVTNDELRQAFAPFGQIVSAKVMADEAGRSREFGFVCFSTPEEAQKAIAGMNDTEFKGKKLYVTVAQRRDHRKSPLIQLSPFYGANGPMLGQLPPQPHDLYQQHKPQHFHSGRGPQPHHQHHPQQFRNAGVPIPNQFVPSYAYYPQANYGAGGAPAGSWSPDGVIFTGVPPAINYSILSNNGPQQFRNNGKPGFNNNNNNNSSGSNRSPRQGHRHSRGNRNNNSGSGASNSSGANSSSSTAGASSSNAGSFQTSRQNSQVLYGSTLSAVVASAANPEVEKQILGEALYPKIVSHIAVKGDTELTSKLTGMMLDLGTQELLKWIDDEVVLNTHIQQAYDQYMEFLANEKHNDDDTTPEKKD